MTGVFKVFTGSINRPLAESICHCLNIEMGKAEVGHFRGGETRVKIGENVRGKSVLIVQPICASADYGLSPNDALMEILLMTDAARRASALEIIAFIPYLGYARQDRKDEPRVPISAKVVMDMLETAGATRIFAMDLHSQQIQGFTNLPFDTLYSSPTFLAHLRRRKIPNLTIASGDIGGSRMARAYSTSLHVPYVIIDKRRDKRGKSEVMNIIGDVKGHHVLIVDDIASTAGTLDNAGKAIIKKGALSVSALCVHPVLVPAEGDKKSAVEIIEQSPLTEVLVTDTIPLPAEMATKKIRVISVAPLLAKAIRRIHSNQSLSALFNVNKVDE